MGARILKGLEKSKVDTPPAPTDCKATRNKRLSKIGSCPIISGSSSSIGSTGIDTRSMDSRRLGDVIRSGQRAADGPTRNLRGKVSRVRSRGCSGIGGKVEVLSYGAAIMAVAVKEFVWSRRKGFVMFLAGSGFLRATQRGASRLRCSSTSSIASADTANSSQQVYVKMGGGDGGDGGGGAGLVKRVAASVSPISTVLYQEGLVRFIVSFL